MRSSSSSAGRGRPPGHPHKAPPIAHARAAQQLLAAISALSIGLILARSADEAAEELLRCAGSQFVPAVVDAFLAVTDLPNSVQTTRLVPRPLPY
jgi:hypothetical protein